MADLCPAPDANDPLVQTLLSSVDCHVGSLVQTAYGSVSGGGGLFGEVLNAFLILYVALMGFQLMLGRSPFGLTGFATSAVKLGAILALVTQWPAYQTLVYDFLSYGPQQVGAAILKASDTQASGPGGDVFDQLQRSYDALNQMGAAYALHTPAQFTTLAGTDALAGVLLSWSGLVLVGSTLGLLLAAKIVLGVLLALGPIFIAFLLFGATEGVFEGWLRASIAFALAPLFLILSLAMAMTMLSPSLDQILELQKQGVYTFEPVSGVMILIGVFALVSVGAAVASGVVGYSFRLPNAARTTNTMGAAPVPTAVVQTVDISRVSRMATATSVLDRREARVSSSIVNETRDLSGRVVITSLQRSDSHASSSAVARLGEQRRRAQPRAARQNVRSTR